MSVRRSLAWAFSGQLLTFLIQFGGSLAIARLLSPRELGIFAISMAALGIVQVFATFGMASFLVREPELTPTTVDTAFTVNALLMVMLSAILVGLSFAAGPLLGEVHAAPVLRIVAVSNLFGIASFLPLAMLQREMQFKRLAAISAVQATTQTLATIGFALAGASYRSPAYAALLAAAAAATLAMAFGRRHVRIRPSMAGWRPITAFGLQMMSVSGVAMMTGRLSDLLLGRLLGVAALGLYGRASNLSNLIFENLYGTATRVIFVQLSRDYRDGGDWRATYLRGFAMISAVMWPFLTGLAILSGPAIRLLYGARWLPAALPLSALMIAQVVGVAFGMNWELFVLRGETGRQARYEMTRLVLGLPIFAAGCLFSILAAAAAKIADALIGFFLYYPHVRRLAELGPREIPVIYRDSALLTLAAVLPAFAVMVHYRWSPTAALPAVFSAVGMGMALWLGMILLLDHPLRDEMSLLWSNLRARRRGRGD